jgi:hypothetical protein
MANNQQLLMGEGAGSAPAVYIEDVFSTYLYTGNGSTQTITNNIDLSTKGGMVWIKNRTDVVSHYLWDTVRGITPSSHKSLQSDTTAAQVDYSSGFGVQSVSSTGFELGGLGTGVNGSTKNYASWTFRKQPKFFDVVTYTGTGSSQNIAHNLGSVPGCIIIKRTDTAANWGVVARTTGTTYAYFTSSSNGLNVTAAAGGTLDFSSAITATYFEPSYLRDTGGDLNTNGGTYVAYLFAHDAGGFGASGTDNVISCGSFTTDGSGNIPAVTLGWEPQYLLVKASNNADIWRIHDTQRGWDVSGQFAMLRANDSNAEAPTATSWVRPTATGFEQTNSPGFGAGAAFIYIAIRRGPMKVPTVGTSVYNAEAFTGTGATRAITTLSAPDMAWVRVDRNTTNANTVQVYDRLRGNGVRVRTGLTNADNTNAAFLQFNNQMLATVGNDSETNRSGASEIAWAFKRAPGFFDVVCYTVTTSSQAVSHNLGVTPELIIYKNRSVASPWYVWTTGYSTNKYLNLNNAQGQQTYTLWGTMSSTIFTVVDSGSGGETLVAYLFATCAGVSKVGSYTGNGSNQTIACGFAAGSRFVMIRRTDAGIGGDWYVWDSARGIVAGNDPHLSLNTTAAEVTSDDSVDTDNSGFIVNQDAATNVNVTSATYIFLAIA